MTPDPPVRVISDVQSVAKLSKVKSTLSLSANKANPTTRLEAVSVALLLSAVGVHFTIPVKMFAADIAVVPSSVVASGPWYVITAGLADARAYTGP